MNSSTFVHGVQDITIRKTRCFNVKGRPDYTEVTIYLTGAGGDVMDIHIFPDEAEATITFAPDEVRDWVR